MYDNKTIDYPIVSGRMNSWTLKLYAMFLCVEQTAGSAAGGPGRDATGSGGGQAHRRPRESHGTMPLSVIYYSFAHLQGGISAVASLMTIDEQL